MVYATLGESNYPTKRKRKQEWGEAKGNAWRYLHAEGRGLSAQIGIERAVKQRELRLMLRRDWILHSKN